MSWMLGIGVTVGALLVLLYVARSTWRGSVRQRVRDELRERHPEVEIVREGAGAFELRLAEGVTGTLNLGNLYAGLAMGPREDGPQREMIRSFVAGALAQQREAHQPLSLEVHGERLRPRLALPGFLAEAASSGEALLQRPTGLPELVTVYVLDSESAVMYLGASRLAELGLGLEALHERALANLRRRPITSAVRGVVERSEVAVLKSGDSYDAARLLLVPEALGEGETVVAVIPDRETLGLLPCPPEGDAAWAPIRKLARTPASPYCLLDRPLRVTRAGFAKV